MENWKNLVHLFVMAFLYNIAGLLVNPTIADVTMEAVCPGKDECSLAIYLTGTQQAIGGLGAVIMMPMIGNLSDFYGRKLFLTILLFLNVVPLGVLAVNRSTEFFYVYYVLKTITSMFVDGGIICLSLSYLADNVSEAKRVTAFGLISGVVSAAMVVGTLAARLLPTNRIFPVAAVTAVAALVYMKLFLEDTPSKTNPLEEPILKNSTDQTAECDSPFRSALKRVPLPKDILRMLRSSFTISLGSFVAFFNSVAEAGIQSFLMYYLKARFGFQKDQFAEIWLITYIAATFSAMVLMPILGPLLGEETLLCVGLFAGFLNMLLDSIAWAPWVPYVSAGLGVFLFLASPSLRCIISKQVGPYEQGIAQGCLMAVTSFANVISPLIYSPLSALFLSDTAPFYFPGFSILCVGLSWFIGFCLSTVIKIEPIWTRRRASREPCLLA